MMDLILCWVWGKSRESNCGLTLIKFRSILKFFFVSTLVKFIKYVDRFGTLITLQFSLSAKSINFPGWCWNYNHFLLVYLEFFTINEIINMCSLKLYSLCALLKFQYQILLNRQMSPAISYNLQYSRKYGTIYAKNV